MKVIILKYTVTAFIIALVSEEMRPGEWLVLFSFDGIYGLALGVGA